MAVRGPLVIIVTDIRRRPKPGLTTSAPAAAVAGARGSLRDPPCTYRASREGRRLVTVRSSSPGEHKDPQPRVRGEQRHAITASRCRRLPHRGCDLYEHHRLHYWSPIGYARSKANPRERKRSLRFAKVIAQKMRLRCTNRNEGATVILPNWKVPLRNIRAASLSRVAEAIRVSQCLSENASSFRQFPHRPASQSLRQSCIRAPPKSLRNRWCGCKCS